MSQSLSHWEQAVTGTNGFVSNLAKSYVVVVIQIMDWSAVIFVDFMSQKMT